MSRTDPTEGTVARETFEEGVERLLRDAPPMSPEVAAEVAALLRPYLRLEDAGR